jgi:hypothetical protein
MIHKCAVFDFMINTKRSITIMIVERFWNHQIIVFIYLF